MKRKRIHDLLKAVEKELAVAERHYREVKHASDEMQKTAAISWSSGGDREYAKGQEELNLLKLNSLRKLHNELVSSANSSLPKIITPPSWVKYAYKNEDKELYLVDHVVNLVGFVLVSKESPLGAKLIGKKINDSFYFGGESDKVYQVIEIG